MTTASSLGVRLGAVSLALAGVLFVLYPLLRPCSDEASLFLPQRASGEGRER